MFCSEVFVFNIFCQHFFILQYVVNVQLLLYLQGPFSSNCSEKVKSEIIKSCESSPEKNYFWGAPILLARIFPILYYAFLFRWLVSRVQNTVAFFNSFFVCWKSEIQFFDPCYIYTFDINFIFFSFNWLLVRYGRYFKVSKIYKFNFRWKLTYIYKSKQKNILAAFSALISTCTFNQI